MLWRPSFDYGDGLFEATLPMQMHSPRFHTGGGMRVSDTGATATYRRRRDRKLVTPVRFWESELPSIVALVDWCHDNGMGPVTVRADQDVAGTQFLAYLESPGFNQEWEPDRDEGDKSVFILPLVWRRTTDTIINLPRFT